MANKEDEQVLDWYSVASRADRLYRDSCRLDNRVIATAKGSWTAAVKVAPPSYTTGTQARFQREMDILTQPTVDISDLLHDIRIMRGSGDVQNALKAMEMRNPSRTALGRHVNKHYYAGEVVVEAAGRDPQTNQTVYAVSNENGRLPLAAESYKKELAEG